jgi:hypothetical protein
MSNANLRKVSRKKRLPRPNSKFVAGAMPWAPLESYTRARVRRGSQAEPIVLLVYDEASQCGHGIRSAVIAEALRVEGWSFPLPVNQLLSGLIQRGVLCSRGTGNQLRYTPPRFVEANIASVRSDAEKVYEALRLACEEWQSMVPTLAISNKLKQCDWILESKDSNAVGKRLETLSRSPSKAARAAAHPPLVRFERVADSSGAAAMFWAPVDAPLLRCPAECVSNAADAARSVIRRLQEQVGRPVSRSEIWLLIRTLDEHRPIRYFLAPGRSDCRLMRALGRCVQTDLADRPERPGNALLARPYENAYSVSGGAPTRYLVAPAHVGANPVIVFGETALAALLVDDIVYVSAIDYELIALSDKMRGISAVDAKIIEPWLSLREHGARVVVARISAALDAEKPATVGRDSPRIRTESDVACLIAGAELLAGGDRYLATLADTAAPGFSNRAVGQRDAIKARLQRRRQAVPILCAALRQRTIPPQPGSQPNIVGIERTSIRLANLRAWATQNTDGELRQAVEACRRFPPPLAAAVEHVRRFSRPLKSTWLDRAEALTALGELVQDAWTRGMIKRAYSYLGWTTRNDDVFGACLLAGVATIGVSPSFRRRMLVAAGLLGAEATIEAADRMLQSAAKRATTEDASADVRAAFLAATLVSPEHATRLVTSSLCATMTGSLAERVAKAARRLRTGHVLSVSAP